MMDAKNLLPIVAGPDFPVLAGPVRNGAPPRGEGQADVWLERSEADTKTPAGAKP